MSMPSLHVFETFVWLWIALAVVVFVTLFFVTAPYGRHAVAGWGPTLPARWGWFIMEAPAPLLVAAGLAFGARSVDRYAALLGALFLAHYLYRAFLFPLRLPRDSKRMPLSIVLSAVLFNLVNGSIQGLWLGALAPQPFPVAFDSPRTLFGLALFAAGALTHLWADGVLFRLRRRGEGYRIPHGGLYRFVSCPNYLGEIVEWAGFALIMAALPGLAFLVWTIANLAPRALRHHRWYRERFPDYPANRRALVPFLY